MDELELEGRPFSGKSSFGLLRYLNPFHSTIYPGPSRRSNPESMIINRVCNFASSWNPPLIIYFVLSTQKEKDQTHGLCHWPQILESEEFVFESMKSGRRLSINFVTGLMHIDRSS